MNSRRFFLLLVVVCCCSIGNAQSAGEDKELSSLVDVVKMLRISNETNFNKATQILEHDTKWTPMDETGAVREGKECKASDKVLGFKLNRILSKINGGRKYVSTHGDMVNGEDTRYDYSLYERALKARAEVNYRLKGREGKQTFVIVPYDKSAKIDVRIESEGNKVHGKQNPDGTIVITWASNTPSKSQTFDLVIKNNSGTSQSFVIINHNTRKK